MSEFRPDFTSVRPYPPSNPPRLRRTQSHIPGTGTGTPNLRSSTYYNTFFNNKNRPKEGLLPSPRLDFNRMYSPTALRLQIPPVDLDRSRSPSPAPPLHFTPLHHTHDLSLSAKREANPASPCSVTNTATANSVPPKTFQTPLLINYMCSCIVPAVHPLTLTSPSCPTGTPGVDVQVPRMDPPIHTRLSKSLIPEFRDGSHSPEPPAPLHRSPSPNELKCYRGVETHSIADSDYDSGSSNSIPALHSPLDTRPHIDLFTPSVACGSERSSGCSSPSIESDSDSAIHAPARLPDCNRPGSYKTESEHFFASSSSSSSSSPEPGQYPIEDVLFIDNSKLPNTPRRSPVTTPCSSHVYQLSASQPPLSLQRHSVPVAPLAALQQYSKGYYSHEGGRHSYPHSNNNNNNNNNNSYRHGGHPNRRRQQSGGRDAHGRYQYGYYSHSDSSQGAYASLPPSQSCFINLSQDMWKNSRTTKQEESVILAKRNYCQKLAACVQELFEGVQFCIVGSSMNGFSTSDCDLDLCMMTPNHPIQTRQSVLDALWEVSQKLREKRIGKEHQVIHAKTPIIKFRDPDSGFDVDISVNNLHGIRNTHLLRTYSQLDDRVRPLVVMIKQWFKRQQIANARIGTLSSYSITLMVIFYLQAGCSPSVLPSLQELSPEIFDSWSVYPQELQGRHQLKWASSNQQNLPELLIGFFNFFSEFNYHNVMSIRTGSVIPPTYDQIGCIRIEEPYTRENVAHSVSKPWCFNSIKSHIQHAYLVLLTSEVSSIDALYNNRPINTIPSSFGQNFYL